MNNLLLVFDVGINFLVPAVVWATLAVGAYQLARQAIRKNRVAPRGLSQGTQAQRAG